MPTIEEQLAELRAGLANVSANLSTRVTENEARVTENEGLMGALNSHVLKVERSVNARIDAAEERLRAELPASARHRTRTPPHSRY